MKDSNKDYTISGYSNETKAVSEFFLLVNGVFESFKNLTIQIQDGQAEATDQLKRKRRVKKHCDQITIKNMPLENLIRTGFYPF
jgi:hypothetical protein